MENKNDKQFNALEKAILEWYVTYYHDDNLTAQIRSAKFEKREWTRKGFYIDLKISYDLKPIDFSVLLEMVKPSDDLKQKYIKGSFPISGPYIRSNDIEDGGRTLLFGKDGYITFLELYAFGEHFKEHITNFELCDTLEGISIAPTSPSLTTSPMEKLKRVIGFFKK